MSSTSLETGTMQTFHPFPRLPTEIRAQIWQVSIRAHIIRWIRIDDEAKNSSNLFNISTRDLPLLGVSHDAREAVFFNGVSLQSKRPAWFFPWLDYLHLDPAWTNLSTHSLTKDPLDSLPFDFKLVQKIMVNPNYTDNRLKPGVLLERMPLLETILVVADERSIGAQSKFMHASVYDLKKYFEGVKRKNPEANIPYIAVGCLGWVGDEKTKSFHRNEDGRQLIAVFEGEGQMKKHLKAVREEEIRFLKEKFYQQNPGFNLRFRAGQSMDSLRLDSAASASKPPDLADDAPPETSETSEVRHSLPTYSQVVSGDEYEIERENSSINP